MPKKSKKSPPTRAARATQAAQPPQAPNTVVTYDNPLPEIPNRCPWQPPASHLVRDRTHPDGWREKTGRRPSELLLVPAIRAQVNRWRANDYPGASPTAQHLLHYWFHQDHLIHPQNAAPTPLRYHFCQREAIETLIWATEIFTHPDTQTLIRAHAATHTPGALLPQNLAFQTDADGTRLLELRKPDPNGNLAIHQYPIPPENLRRLAFKMATGAGKTWVMAMAIVWSYFHKLREPDSPLARNFLIVAPNIIVYQRLARDFASGQIFRDLPLVPPEWRGDFHPKTHLRAAATLPDGAGNLFLTNIQQIYKPDPAEEDWTPKSAIETILGHPPATNADKAPTRTMRDNILTQPDLLVINDEAHHTHSDKQKWNESLLDMHANLPRGLAAWLDFSATPKDQNGAYFPWTVTDYPLAQAVEDRIVKSPIIFIPTNMPDEPDGVNKDNVVEKYAPWITSAVTRLREHEKTYQPLDKKPVLFVMTETTAYADKIGAALHTQFGFAEQEVLVIHTDKAGEITKKDLDKARQAAAEIDDDESPVKAIVSVLMLREGWDVKNVTVALGLRPFTAAAGILPEQVIGRGLRLMTGLTGDRTQTLEALGSPRLLQHLRDQLELDGVSVITTAEPPPPPITIFPVADRAPYDIAIPLTEPRLERDPHRLHEFSVAALAPIYDYNKLPEQYRIRLEGRFPHTDSNIHETEIHIPGGELEVQLRRIAEVTVDRTKLAAHFAWIYRTVIAYVTHRCFGQTVNLQKTQEKHPDPRVRESLNDAAIREAIANYLARAIAEFIVTRGEIKFVNRTHLLSKTKPFPWRRNLHPEPLQCDRTIFNYVATYNDYERRFAQFLDRATDITRFAALGTTQQGESGTDFRIDYLKPNGAIAFYHPDWVAVQTPATPTKATKATEIHWIIETKGREWQDTPAKDEAMKRWCQDITEATGAIWRYTRINQPDFEAAIHTHTLADLLKHSHSPT